MHSKGYLAQTSNSSTFLTQTSSKAYESESGLSWNLSCFFVHRSNKVPDGNSLRSEVYLGLQLETCGEDRVAEVVVYGDGSLPRIFVGARKLVIPNFTLPSK